MKYMLIFMCDVCDAKGQGEIVPPMGIRQPCGWACRVWPNGFQSLVCSKRCQVELDKNLITKSIIMPKPLPLVRGRNVSMATKAS
jgi:hypothetical protein